MFNKGDIIIGKPFNGYGCTNEYALMVVAKVYSSSDMMDVYIISHGCDYGEIGNHYDVRNRDVDFANISFKEYFELYHDAEVISEAELNWILSKNDITIDITGLYNERSLIAASPYELSAELRGSLMEEMRCLLKKYGYHPTDKGLNAIIDEWARSKADLIRMFEKHPNYNGKFQIVFDADYDREVNPAEIKKFISMLYDNNDVTNLILKEYVNKSPFSYEECVKYRNRNKNICEILEDYDEYIKDVNGLTYKEANANYYKWHRLVKEYESKACKFNGYWFTKESYNMFRDFRYILDNFYSYYDNTLNTNMSNCINDRFPSFGAKRGQKTSRALNKLCTMFGIDKIDGYNQQFAKYSDAINPLTIKRYTVLSVHPIDFFTMSFGNSWSSCHTIDKKNIRKMPNSYEGRYSGGTESYMLDKTSMVLYTVDKSYEGTELELQPKINRNMFHYGYDKLIQGRVYPQSNDEKGNAIYKMFRETVQKIISECRGDTNSWLNVKGIDECSSITRSLGVHYPDYLHFDNCNVSYYNKEKNPRRIIIGKNHICPCCGRVHSRDYCIECTACY